MHIGILLFGTALLFAIVFYGITLFANYDSRPFHIFGALTLACAIAAFILGLVAGGQTLETIHCEHTAQAYGVPYDYSWAGGCFIQVDGQWIASEAYRIAEVK